MIALSTLPIQNCPIEYDAILFYSKVLSLKPTLLTMVAQNFSMNRKHGSTYRS